eukprot:4417328-Alexandrium_andersonii.AAC.1
MSASLVGSEMCIRDSCGLDVRGPCHAGGSAAGPERPERRGSCHCGRPVSYTHLTLPTICSV